MDHGCRNLPEVLKTLTGLRAVRRWLPGALCLPVLVACTEAPPPPLSVERLAAGANISGANGLPLLT